MNHQPDGLTSKAVLLEIYSSDTEMFVVDFSLGNYINVGFNYFFQKNWFKKFSYNYILMKQLFQNCILKNFAEYNMKYGFTYIHILKIQL